MGASAMHGLSLEWKHCPDGVDLVDLGPEKPRGPTIAHGVSGGECFRPRTSRRYPIKVSITDLEDPVVLRFINAQDDEARAGFLSRFGMPHKDAQEEYFLEEIKHDQKVLRKLLVSAGSDQPDNSAINKKMRFELSPVLDGRQLSFGLNSLHGLMLREVVMVVEKDARFTTCLHCHKAFLTGPTTGRRSHASYCSDRCRVAAMRARNAR